MAVSRSACSVLVGMPVLGPARCTSITTSGSSVITASPMPSAFNERPGPLVPVAPIAPPNDAPMAAHAGGDLVLGLERADVVFLVLRQLVQNLAGRRDRITGIDQRPAGAMRGRDQPQRGRFVARHAPVASLGQPGRGHRVLHAETVRPCRRSCIRPASWRRWRPSRPGCCGTSSSATPAPAEADDRTTTGSTPGRRSSCTARRPCADNCMWLHRFLVQPRHGHGNDAKRRQFAARRADWRRIAALARLAAVNSSSFTTMMPPGCKSGETDLQGRRIHGDQDIGRIARRVDLVVGEIELEAAHPSQRARRGADLGRIIRKRADHRPGHRGDVGELAARQLHAVARIAREPHRGAGYRNELPRPA